MAYTAEQERQIQTAMLWMERHPAATAYTAQSRQGFQATHGAIDQALWDAATGRTVYERRATAAVLGAHGNARLDTALGGLYGAQQTIRVRVYIEGTDVAGHYVRFVQDIDVDRSTRIRDLEDMALDASTGRYAIDRNRGYTTDIVGIQQVPGA